MTSRERDAIKTGGGPAMTKIATSPNGSWHHLVGDRVSRDIDAFCQPITPRLGRVIKRYSQHSRRFGRYPELYAVRFDDGTAEKGFLWHGLTAVNSGEPHICTGNSVSSVVE